MCTEQNQGRFLLLMIKVNIMKFFGYSKDGDVLLDMAEVSLQANPHQLKSFAAFILKCADGMQKDSQWEHEHYSDNCESVGGAFDFIIFKDEDKLVNPSAD